MKEEIEIKERLLLNKGNFVQSLKCYFHWRKASINIDIIHNELIKLQRFL